MAYLIATVIAVLLVSLCIVTHYEALRLLSRMIDRPDRHRRRIIVMMHGLLLAHVVEVWIFGIGHYMATRWLGLGALNVPPNGTATAFFDYIYYSAMVYTTVGFGDVVPEGAVRMISSTEAVAGLALISWSASFTFLQMGRLWRR